MGALLGIGGGPFPGSFLGNCGLDTGEGVLALTACTAEFLCSSGGGCCSLTGLSLTSADACGTDTASTEGSLLVLEVTGTTT